MTAPLGDLSPERFLQEFWQKKPCLIRQAIPDFEPLLDGDDLAGLACEEMAESRLSKVLLLRLTGVLNTARSAMITSPPCPARTGPCWFRMWKNTTPPCTH